MTHRVLVVADAGPDSGLGHLSRSTAVAVALHVRGFVPTCFANGALEPIERDGIRWLPLDERDSLPPGEEIAAIVLDSYRIVLREPPNVLLAVLQERTESPPGAALVVNAGGDPVEGGKRRLYGPAYACLRPSFWGLPAATPRELVERVVVTTGAGDPGGVGSALVGAVHDAIPAARITVVRGPFAPSAELPDARIVHSPESLLPLLLEADLVVTAGGQTMLEAAAAGTPTVALALVENQEAQAQRLASLGAVRLASLESLAVVLSELAADRDDRRRLGERAQTAVDGYGALRVAFAIARLIQPDGA